MTVAELITQLQKLKDRGLGELPIHREDSERYFPKLTGEVSAHSESGYSVGYETEDRVWFVVIE